MLSRQLITHESSNGRVKKIVSRVVKNPDDPILPDAVLQEMTPDERQHHVLRLLGYDPEEYLLKTIDVETNPHQPCTTFVVEPNPPRVVTFLKLPVEIRSEIYRLVLTKDCYYLSIISRRMHLGLCASVRVQLESLWQPHLDQIPDATNHIPLKGFGLLSACKTIQNEAAGILYGNNTFSFRTYDAAVSFLEALRKDNRAQMRRMIMPVQPARLKEAATMLSDCKNLRHLQLNVEPRHIREIGDLEPAAVVVSHFKTVIVQMYMHDPETFWERFVWKTSGRYLGKSAPRNALNDIQSYSREMGKNIRKIIERHDQRQK